MNLSKDWACRRENGSNGVSYGDGTNSHNFEKNLVNGSNCTQCPRVDGEQVSSCSEDSHVFKSVFEIGLCVECDSTLLPDGVIC